MVTLSNEASAQIKEYFNGKDVQPIRIFLSQGGCSGRSGYSQITFRPAAYQASRRLR